MNIKELNEINKLENYIKKLKELYELRDSDRCYYNEKLKHEVKIKIYLLKREIAQFEMK